MSWWPYATIRPSESTTSAGTGNTRTRRTLEPALCASAATAGTIASPCSPSPIGVKILFAIVITPPSVLGMTRRAKWILMACTLQLTEVAKGERHMLHYALMFLIVGLIAGLLGLTGIAAVA